MRECSDILGLSPRARSEGFRRMSRRRGRPPRRRRQNRRPPRLPPVSPSPFSRATRTRAPPIAWPGATASPSISNSSAGIFRSCMTAISTRSPSTLVRARGALDARHPQRAERGPPTGFRTHGADRRPDRLNDHCRSAHQWCSLIRSVRAKDALSHRTSSMADSSCPFCLGVPVNTGTVG